MPPGYVHTTPLSIKVIRSNTLDLRLLRRQSEGLLCSSACCRKAFVRYEICATLGTGKFPGRRPISLDFENRILPFPKIRKGNFSSRKINTENFPSRLFNSSRHYTWVLCLLHGGAEAVDLGPVQGLGGAWACAEVRDKNHRSSVAHDKR